MWTGNDVISVSPLGGVAGQRSMRILKGTPDFLFAINFNFCFIYSSFRVIQIFSFGWEFLFMGDNIVK